MQEQKTVLKNDTLVIEIASLGAELKRVACTRTNIEYLWHGDPKYWGRSSPILFPIVGRLKDDRYVFAGSPYTLKQHGFARDSLFALVHESADRAVFELDATGQPKPEYPFRFSLRVAYALVNQTVRISYTVINRDAKKMCFSIGSHPAFNIPLSSGNLTDYFIEFTKEEENVCYRIEGGLQSAGLPSVLNTGRTLRLSTNLFDRDAIVFKNLHSDKISIKNDIDDHSIVVDVGGAPYLGLWSKPGAPFVCIEPWFGIADGPNSDDDLTTKEGIRSLGPGEVFEAEYSISVS